MQMRRFFYGMENTNHQLAPCRLAPVFPLQFQHEFQLHQCLLRIIEFNKKLLHFSNLKTSIDNFPGLLVDKLDLDYPVASGLLYDPLIAPAHLFILLLTAWCGYRFYTLF